MNFGESGEFRRNWLNVLKLTGSDELIKYKISRSEVLIKIIEIIIKIDLHIFLLHSQRLYDRIHKYHIFHMIFAEP